MKLGGHKTRGIRQKGLGAKPLRMDHLEDKAEEVVARFVFKRYMQAVRQTMVPYQGWNLRCQGEGNHTVQLRDYDEDLS